MACSICLHLSSRLSFNISLLSSDVKLSVYVVVSAGGHEVFFVFLRRRRGCSVFVDLGRVIVLRSCRALWSEPRSIFTVDSLSRTVFQNCLETMM